jgi:hypothetical protein
MALFRFFAMVASALTENERAVLETLAVSGPERGLDPAMRGRLALYKLIDETPKGWKITALGREALAASQPRSEFAPPRPDDETRPAPADGERHYGRKSRDTSWLD